MRPYREAVSQLDTGTMGGILELEEAEPPREGMLRLHRAAQEKHVVWPLRHNSACLRGSGHIDQPHPAEAVGAEEVVRPARAVAYGTRPGPHRSVPLAWIIHQPERWPA